MLPVWRHMPLIELVLRRVRAAHSLAEVVLATTSRPIDDPLIEVAERLGVAVYRGSEDDVLERFAGALDIHEADGVVRVCADNPFVSPTSIDALAGFFEVNQPCDYATDGGRPSGRPDHFGAEIMSAEALRRSADRAKAPEEREHMSAYVLGHREEFSLAFTPAVNCGGKLDIDTADDYLAMRALAERLPEAEAPLWPPEAIMAAWEESGKPPRSLPGCRSS